MIFSLYSDFCFPPFLWQPFDRRRGGTDLQLAWPSPQGRIRSVDGL